MADLSKMTRKQLEKLKSDAERALKKLETKEKREAKKAAETAAAKFGFKLAELTGEASTKNSAPASKSATPAKKAKTKPRPAKYANPADKKQTWSGFGRKPAWFKEAEEAGKDPKTMEI